MVRVAGLREQAFAAGVPQDINPDGLKSLSQLSQITRRTQELIADQYRCLKEEILLQLAAHGICLRPTAK